MLASNDKCPNCHGQSFDFDRVVDVKPEWRNFSRELKPYPKPKEEHPTMDKFWMIVNVKEREGATRIVGSPNSERQRIPDNCRPNVLHLDEGAAKRELIRLKAANPAGEFVLLEAMSVAVPQPVVTYTLQALESPIPF